MELRQRNNGLSMTTFHHQQPNCAWHSHKNQTTGTFNFTTQIAPPICTAMHTKRVKTDATIFKSRCSRTVLCYRFDRVDALLLSKAKVFRLANGSPKLVRNPARRPHDGRGTSSKTTGEMSRIVAAQLPGNGRATANTMSPDDRRGNSQDNLRHAGLGRAVAAPATCETTRNLATQRSHSHSPHNGHRNISRAARRILAVSFQP
jgi:hypothetical protein